MKTKVIPFGKHKGKPIESLAEDKQYLDWLLSQSWFAENHKDLHTIVINNFQVPSETPEHNSLQALFLDELFRINFLNVGLRQFIPLMKGTFKHIKEGNVSFSTIYRAEFVQGPEPKISRFDFEKKAVDITLHCSFNCLAMDYDEEDGVRTASPKKMRIAETIGLEIKPSVSDDYPAVLRSMLSLGTKILFLESYTGKGASQDQFIKIFNNQGIAVVFRHQVV